VRVRRSRQYGRNWLDPAKAGIHLAAAPAAEEWVPAYAGIIKCAGTYFSFL